MIEGMKLKNTFQQNEIQDGDVICYQVEMSEKECVCATCGDWTDGVGYRIWKANHYTRQSRNSTTSFRIESLFSSSHDTKTRLEKCPTLTLCSAKR